MRMGDEGVPTIEAYLREALPAHATLGFDGTGHEHRHGRAAVRAAQ